MSSINVAVLDNNPAELFSAILSEPEMRYFPAKITKKLIKIHVQSNILDSPVYHF